ncbi:hypothetical protein HGM15179_004925 [Zosterops borbonicus]|uniref:Uncharacterized protein n=1 Tax=Zosterops borbonicus TaxID=364589 RepID=A0A8K1LQ56_9PASS|nr:hypothetical protein HGM15179_004925 [Zosterops borbonicus]
MDGLPRRAGSRAEPELDKGESSRSHGFQALFAERDDFLRKIQPWMGCPGELGAEQNQNGESSSSHGFQAASAKWDDSLRKIQPWMSCPGELGREQSRSRIEQG